MDHRPAWELLAEPRRRKPVVMLLVGYRWLDDPSPARGEWLNGARAYWTKRLGLANVRLRVKLVQTPTRERKRS